MFKNRQQAGRLLAGALQEYLTTRPDYEPAELLVVGLPRGGVVVAAEVARILGGRLDILVSKKIGAPDNPELAIGAVSSGGDVVLDERIARILGHPDEYHRTQEKEKERLTRETVRMEERWLAAAGVTERWSPKNRRVVVVDDGLATGMTALAALRTLRSRQPRELIMAAPVAPADTLEKVKPECDTVIVLHVPYDFTSVGYYYQDFSQVSDDEVVACLKEVAPAG